MFEIGDKVKCVNAVRPTGKNPNVVPNWVKDSIEYTIRGFHDNDNIVVGVLLEEVTNPMTPIPLINRWQEPAFATWRFEKTASAEVASEEDEDAMPRELQEMLEDLELS
tara:strand:+ start:2147 stop:2473 length:327 start_codon:yes stop_codon:yes gene_type:complete